MSIYDWSTSGALAPQLIRRQGIDTPYFRAGSLVHQSGNFTPLDKKYVKDGKISLASSGVVKKGSNSLTINDAGFSYLAQNPFVDTVTLYWDGTNGSKVPHVNRSDGTSQPVPAGNITIKGLKASTTYYVLPYWSNENPCAIGFAFGTVGSPQICFTDTNSVDALIQQNLEGNDPLTSGYASFTTPAAGGSGGGPSGGGGYKPCVMVGTEIETVDGIEHFEKLSPHTDWWHLVVRHGSSLFCTPDHPVYDEHGFRKEAQKYRVGDRVTMQYGSDEIVVSEPHRRVCTKVQVEMMRVHLFYANRFLCHNYKPNTA